MVKIINGIDVVVFVSAFLTEVPLLQTTAYAATLPAGYKQAFTFNMINIPKELQKPGRIFALRVIDKSGNVIFLPDIDDQPDTITVTVNVEGYAFELIYKD